MKILLFINIYSVFIGTWNVNGRNPDCSLKEWLNSYKNKTPDIYVIGYMFILCNLIKKILNVNEFFFNINNISLIRLQEMDLSKEAYIVSNNEKESQWSEKIEEGINTYNKKYVKVIIYFN